MLIFSMENAQMLSASSCYINTSMVGPELISRFKQHFKYNCNIGNMYILFLSLTQKEPQINYSISTKLHLKKLKIETLKETRKLMG